MSLIQSLRYLSLVGLIFGSSVALANQNILHITVENQSHKAYTLIIYGAGSTYEIIDGFDSLPAQKSATIQIDYRAKDKSNKNQNPVYHILLLNSDEDCCKVEYTAHPAKTSQYHFFKAKRFLAKLKSFEGPCKVWRENTDSLHIILVESAQLPGTEKKG